MTRSGALSYRAIALLALLTLPFSGACKRHDAPTEESADAAVATPEVKDSSTGLLFTWIDDKGDFHIQETVADVPIAGRDAVRVVDPASYDGNHPDRIFLADLRTAGADGAYPVKVTTRAEFDALAAARRAKGGPTLAQPAGSGQAPAGGAPSPASADSASAPGSASAVQPTVIIYGASWCGACHEAAAYLKRKGVPFIEKDIEADANAAREMQIKLAHAGKRTGSIPVIDVRGKLMVGFSAQAMDNALGEAL